VEEIRTVFPQYEILGLQGRGGMGAVFRARQKSLDRLVAIKVLPHGGDDDAFNFAERFKNEARTMARLNHPGIVHVHDFGETADGLLYFIMEFVEGSDVQQLIRQQRRLPSSYALPIAAHVCDALAYAHSHAVIHRDIKPANIMLTRDGVVKVADFGLARLDDPTQPGLTQTGMAMGTPDYVAPEALTLSSPVDARADLYAVGVMLYHMLTGEVPRGMFDMPGKLDAALDPRIDAVIIKAMKQRPEERYQNAAELRADLDAILSTPVATIDGAASAVLPQSFIEAAPPADSAPFPLSHEISLPGRGKSQLLRAAAACLVLGLTAWLLVRQPFRQAGTAPAGNAPQTVQPSVAEDAPVRLDDSKWLPLSYPADFEKINSASVVADGSILIEGGVGRRLRVRWSQADAAVRATVRFPPDGQGIIGLRTDMNKHALRVVLQPAAIEIVHESVEDTDDSDRTVLRRFENPGSDYAPANGVTITAAALGDQCLVWLGSRYLGSASSNTLPDDGKILLDGMSATFRDMQWQILSDGTAPSDIPTPSVLTTADLTGVWPRPDSTSQCILWPDGKIILINSRGEEDRRADGTPWWAGWRWRIQDGKALLSTADGKIQEEWTLTQPGIAAIRHLAKGSTSTSRRGSTAVPVIKPSAVPEQPATLALMLADAKTETRNQKAEFPAELAAAQASFLDAIARQVTTPHTASIAQLDNGYLAALDRAVSARQLKTRDIAADKAALKSKAPLPPDSERTPGALKALRATYRAKITEYDDARTNTHLSLLTTFIARLREMESDLTQKGRSADAAITATYRRTLSENPLPLPAVVRP